MCVCFCCCVCAPTVVCNKCFCSSFFEALWGILLLYLSLCLCLKQKKIFFFNNDDDNRHSGYFVLLCNTQYWHLQVCSLFREYWEKGMSSTPNPSYSVESKKRRNSCNFHTHTQRAFFFLFLRKFLIKLLFWIQFATDQNKKKKKTKNRNLSLLLLLLLLQMVVVWFWFFFLSFNRERERASETL